METIEIVRLYNNIKRIATPMLREEVDRQQIIEDVKDELGMEPTEDNREFILDAIRECEQEISA